MANVIPFPGNAFPLSGGGRGAGLPRHPYEFSDGELERLCRWYSAMKYAFPRLEGVMSICHRTRFSAVGLYGAGGTTPSCLISKHELAGGGTYFLWSTDQDPPRRLARIDELTERQIGAIAPPRDEARWLDLIGWTSIVSNRLIGSHLRTV